MNYEDENSEYLQKNQSYHTEDSSYKAKNIIHLLRKNNISFNNVVEVGCGAGQVLNSVSENMGNGIKFKGYDISKDGINYAKQNSRNDIEFFNDDFLKLNSEHNLLLLIDVFEHVENYIDFLRALHKRSEYFVFHIPLDISVESILRDSLSWSRNQFGHIHYFTKEIALAVLRDLNFEILDSIYTKDIDFPRNSIGSKISFIPRKIVDSINQDFAAKVLGGYSIMVLAKRKIEKV